MAHYIRQQNLLRLAREVENNKIDGAIVECGVLDGGTAAIMAYGTSNRAVHLFDSWEGLPNITEKDGLASAVWAGDVVGSPKRVAAVMNALCVDPRRLHYHRGWFSDTFPKAQIDKIALLHVDGDFYESVKLTLQAWSPKVTVGGYMQIDDYQSFLGCRTAVDEFLSDHPGFILSSVGIDTKAYYIKRTH